jgi:drug/metabolite transporter (DMT)-like permease
VRILCGTVLALLGFAANSLLCRLALGAGEIDAASFITLRLVSGALALWAIAAAAAGRRDQAPKRDWVAASMLFLYAAGFSFAYLSLDAGVGALVLFAAVQATMIGSALVAGERPRPVEWSGLLVALGGLAWLVAPGLSAPSPLGAASMAGAGAAWGVYSLRGRRAGDPLRRTRDNFVRAVPMAVALSALTLHQSAASMRGILLAVVSGAVTSGAGYAVWYSVLPALTATRAAMVQLVVPVLAAGGGVAFLGETLSWRLVGSAGLILGGVGLALTARSRPAA